MTWAEAGGVVNKQAITKNNLCFIVLSGWIDTVLILKFHLFVGRMQVFRLAIKNGFSCCGTFIEYVDRNLLTNNND